MKNKVLLLSLICCSGCYADHIVAPAFLWDASKDTLGRVITGSPDETSGYWWDYNDENSGGLSQFIWPSDVKENEMGNFYGPMIQVYGGIQGSFVLRKKDNTSNPYVGLGFNIWSIEQEGVDISQWNGLCVEYSSSTDFRIKIGYENERYESINDADFWFKVDASESIVAVDFPWAKANRLWGPVMESSEYIKKISSLKFVFTGPDSTTGDFKITKIGSLGTCDGTVPVESVSLPRSVASAPMAQFRKVPGGFEVLDKALVGKSYSLFDLNGIQIRTGELPAVLKTPAVPTILRIKERIHYLR
ncbi:MAG: hypothetical protein IJ977_06020 [Fibrobacter sp.]|nr:hypothetical protein [Fibrobacter sp.]MBR2307786.1 hypothetical protein [Fibrobacter sp.]